MKKIVTLAFILSLALAPLTALADQHADSADKAAASANAAAETTTDTANNGAECHTKCAHDKDVKACTDKCTAEMNAGHDKAMGHAKDASDHSHDAAGGKH
jgi:hypothetical protein